jgi:hypothetical protein
MLLAFLFAAVLSGCGAFDSGSTWRSGQFEVIWLDEPSDSHLSYRVNSSSLIQLVGPCIVAAGASEQFVVVEQRPPKGAGEASYFIVSKTQYKPSMEPRSATVGPLSVAELKSEASRSALPELQEIMPPSMCRSAT